MNTLEVCIYILAILFALPLSNQMYMEVIVVREVRIYKLQAAYFDACNVQDCRVSELDKHQNSVQVHWFVVLL